MTIPEMNAVISISKSGRSDSFHGPVTVDLLCCSDGPGRTGDQGVEGDMQINKLETMRHPIGKRGNGKHPIVVRASAKNGDTRAFQHALKALGTAYARVATMLDDALERSDNGLSQLAALGANYAWVSDRRQLVKTFLESEPAILAYAYSDCPRPDQIRSLAETAADLARERDTLTSALGLLNYIDLELGWADGEGCLAVG
jgi:hypothetical protein